MSGFRWSFASVLAAVLTALVALWLRFELEQVPSSSAPERGRG